VDITVHEKLAFGNLKEVHRASGGPWGGTFVDSEFIKLLSDIVGGPVMADFMKKEKFEYLELMRQFETVKREVGLQRSKPVRIQLPFGLNETCERIVRKDFRELVKRSKNDKLITFIGDKMEIDVTLVQGYNILPLFYIKSRS